MKFKLPELKTILPKAFIVILFLLILDNWVYMFGVLAVYMNADKLKLVSTLFCFILAVNILHLDTDALCTVTIYSYTLLMQGTVSILASLPVKENNAQFCNKYGRFIVVILNILNVSAHPSFELMLSEVDNPIMQSLMKAFSYSLVSKPFVSISELQYTVLITSILYIAILFVFKWLKDKEEWKDLEVHKEIALVLFLDGLLRFVIGAFFVFTSFGVIGSLEG